MEKFKISLPVKMDDIRQLVQKLIQEANLLRACYRKAGTTTAHGQALLEISKSAPLHVNGLTERLQLDKSTVSQTLSQLQNLGLVEIKESASDRRYKVVDLTEQGEEKVDRINRSFDQSLERSLEGLGLQQLNAVGYGLGLFLSSLKAPIDAEKMAPEPLRRHANNAPTSSQPIEINR